MARAEPDQMEMILAARDFVKSAMGKNDASHDWQHCERVWNLVRTLLRQDRLQLSDEDHTVAELAALLHDVDDHKYKDPSREKTYFDEFCEKEKIPGPIRERVLFISDHMSFSKEIGYSKKEFAEIMAKEPVLAYVQDADRLDAIGAIGIARCYTFGGAKGRPLYSTNSLQKEELPHSHGASITQEQYKDPQRDQDGLAHFYEKLFTLKDRIKTPAGKKIRH